MYTSSYGARLSSVPSGDQSVNIATPGASGHSGLQQAHLSAFALKRSGPERLATSKEVFKAARSSIFCRSSASGHRASHSKYTRGQSRETGSLSRLSGSVEASAKCVSLGPAHCRKRLHDSVRVSSASIQQGVSHSGGPQEGRPSRWKKSVLSPVHVRILQYMWPHLTSVGVVWDSTTVQACLSPARIKSILMAVQRVREGQSLTVKQYRKLLGLMAAASNVIPFGLLYMRPLQWWLRTKGFSQRENPFRMIKVTCGGTLVPVTRPSAGGSLSLHTLMTDASLTGWGVGHEWLLRPGSMGRSPSHVAHEFPGDAGHVAGSETRSPRPERPSCAGSQADNKAVVSYINRQASCQGRG